MIKVGFIVEDKAFEATIKSRDFIRVLKNYNIELIGVFNAKGRDSLRNNNDRINDFFKRLKDKNSDYIFVLIDKETDPCITYTVENIYIFDKKKQINIVAAKTIESWFLADSETLSLLFDNEYYYDEPENIKGTPFSVLKMEAIKYTGVGLSKLRNRHTNKIIRNGFSIENAAKHPNCPSAKYFLEKLSQLNPNS